MLIISISFLFQINVYLLISSFCFFAFSCLFLCTIISTIFTNTDKLIDCMSLIQISEISFNDFINIETSRRSGCQIQ